MKGEENKKEKLECMKRIEYMKKLSWISLRVSPFYRELHKIFMDDYPQVTIMVQNFIFYNNFYFNFNLWIKLKNDMLPLSVPFTKWLISLRPSMFNINTLNHHMFQISSITTLINLFCLLNLFFTKNLS